MDKVLERLKAACGFLKVTSMIVASVPDAWAPGCLVTVGRDESRPGIVMVHLDRTQGQTSIGNCKLSTALLAFCDEEVQRMSLLAMHDLARRRVAAAMRRFKTTTLAEVEATTWQDAEIAESLEVC